MNLKEAREITKDPLTAKSTSQINFACGFLEGYAEAEKKAEMLVKALKKIKRLCHGDAIVYARFALVVVKSRITKVMESVTTLRVPLFAKTKVIKNWKEAK